MLEKKYIEIINSVKESAFSLIAYLEDNNEDNLSIEDTRNYGYEIFDFIANNVEMEKKARGYFIIREHAARLFTEIVFDKKPEIAKIANPKGLWWRNTREGLIAEKIRMAEQRDLG